MKCTMLDLGQLINDVAVPQRRTKKSCNICGKTLSSYNRNKYCFAHISKGLEREFRTKEERENRLAKDYQRKRKQRLIEQRGSNWVSLRGRCKGALRPCLQKQGNNER